MEAPEAASSVLKIIHKLDEYSFSSDTIFQNEVTVHHHLQ